MARRWCWRMGTWKNFATLLTLLHFVRSKTVHCSRNTITRYILFFLDIVLQPLISSIELIQNNASRGRGVLHEVFPRTRRKISHLWASWIRCRPIPPEAIWLVVQGFEADTVSWIRIWFGQHLNVCYVYSEQEICNFLHSQFRNFAVPGAPETQGKYLRDLKRGCGVVQRGFRFNLVVIAYTASPISNPPICC